MPIVFPERTSDVPSTARADALRVRSTFSRSRSMKRNCWRHSSAPVSRPLRCASITLPDRDAEERLARLTKREA